MGILHCLSSIIQLDCKNKILNIVDLVFYINVTDKQSVIQLCGYKELGEKLDVSIAVFSPCCYVL